MFQRFDELVKVHLSDVQDAFVGGLEGGEAICPMIKIWYIVFGHPTISDSFQWVY